MNGESGLGGGMIVLWVAIALFFIVCYWKVYTKAGRPGWASIIPIYNALVLMQIVGKPLWWVILLFVPLVNIIIHIIVMLELARRFGKDTAFAVGLILLPVIFVPILAFGSAAYTP